MRLYLNCFEEHPYLWSIDDGTIETERKYVSVVFVKTSGVTKHDLKAPSGQPKCWIEFDGKLDYYPDGTVYVL